MLLKKFSVFSYSIKHLLYVQQHGFVVLNVFFPHFALQLFGYTSENNRDRNTVDDFKKL